MNAGQFIGMTVRRGVTLAVKNTPVCTNHESPEVEVILVNSDEGGHGPCFFACKACGDLLLTQKVAGQRLTWKRITAEDK